KTATRTARSLSGAVARRRFVPQPGWEAQVAIQHPGRSLLPHHRPLDGHPVLGERAHDLRDRVTVGAQDGGAGEQADRLEERGPVGPLEEPRHLLDVETTIPSERFDRLDAATDRTRQDPIDRPAAERRHEPVRLPLALDGQRPASIVSPSCAFPFGNVRSSYRGRWTISVSRMPERRRKITPPAARMTSSITRTASSSSRARAPPSGDRPPPCAPAEPPVSRRARS